MYARFIVDELGYEICKCCDLTEDQIKAIIMDHPEWSIKCLEVIE